MWESIAPLITSITKAGRPFYIAAFLATALLLFLPDGWLAPVGLDSAKRTYPLLIGLVFICAGSLAVVYGAMAM